MIPTCKFYVSIMEPECGLPAEAVEVTYPSGKTEVVALCKRHQPRVTRSQHNANWATRRLENKAARRARLEARGDL